MPNQDYFDNPSWYTVEHWLERKAKEAFDSGFPYGHGELNRFTKTIGMYALYFPDTMEVFFSSSTNLYKDRNKHLSELKRGKHFNKYVQTAFDASHLKTFMFLYQRMERKEDALEFEQRMIDDYSCNPNLLNFHHTEEQDCKKTFIHGMSTIINKYNSGLHMTHDIQKPVKTQTTIDDTSVEKGIILYTDGGARPNPGFMGWGVHGYYYLKTKPKKGAGNTTHIVTASGYVPKADKAKEGFQEVTPLKYFDCFGSSVELLSNNVAELEAARNGITKALEYDVNSIRLYTDSEYVKRGILEWSPTWIRRNWIRSDGQPVPNAEYWKNLLKVIEDVRKQEIDFNIEWVKGHDNILGNVLADKLATIGSSYSSRRVIRNEFKMSPPEGYWKTDNEKHPFIVNKRMYFNTIAAANVPGEYYLGDHGTDDDLIGKKVSDTSYSVVQLVKPEPVLERLRDYQTDIANDIDSLVVARLDKLFSPDTYQEIIDFEEGAFVRGNDYSLDLMALDKKPLTKELRPPRIAMRAIEAISYLKEKLNIFKLEESNPNIENTNLLNFNKHDITDAFYTREIKKGKKGGVDETVFKLKSSFTVGFSLLPLKVKVLKGSEEVEIEIKLTLGIDLPDRNSLKRLEELHPSVNLITWNEGPSTIRFAVIIAASGSYGIWSGIYSNTVFI